MNKGDRNTLLMIVIVFIVSIVALAVVLVISWRLTGPTIQQALDSVGRFIHLQNLNYNFKIPSEDELEREQKGMTPNAEHVLAANITTKAFDYNFRVPIPQIDENEIKIQSAILNDAKLALLNNQNNQAAVSSFSLNIPRIGVDSRVYQGLNAEELLKEGFWTYPASGDLGEGEVLMLCHRRYFGPYDPRTCWNLDKVRIGDSMFINLEGLSLEYKVYDVKVFDANDPNIYNIDKNFDGIRVITCTPLYSDTQRLVVYGERG